MKIELEEIPGSFALCSLPPKTPFPRDLTCAFWAELPDECSLLCLEDEVPDITVQAAYGYKALRVAGILDLSLTGILARISAVLREAEIPLCAVSTYNTDYVFVPARLFQKAAAALEQKDICVTLLQEDPE